jgi:hypothetical protein
VDHINPNGTESLADVVISLAVQGIIAGAVAGILTYATARDVKKSLAAAAKGLVLGVILGGVLKLIGLAVTAGSAALGAASGDILITADDLHARFQAGLYYYAYHKPYQGIKGATPAEVYYAKPPARIDAARPHRAYESKTDQMLFQIAYLDPERLLPVLIPQKAAA